VQAVLLTDALREHDDPKAVAVGFDETTKRELVPWYTASVQQDNVQLKVHRNEPLSDFDAYIRSLIRDGLFPAAGADLDVSRAWMRTFNLLGPPDSLFTDPEITAKVMEFWNDRENRTPEPLGGPTREELLAAIHG
jgi:hypothetical protein